MASAPSIAQLRRQLGLTQLELAERIGVTQYRVSQWEAGTKPPKMEDCAKLEKLFNSAINVRSRLGKKKTDGTEEWRREMRFLRTFYNLRREIADGIFTAMDVVDALAEYEKREYMEAVLKRWKKAGFYYVPQSACILQGRFLWAILPESYKKELEHEH